MVVDVPLNWYQTIVAYFNKCPDPGYILSHGHQIEEEEVGETVFFARETYQHSDLLNIRSWLKERGKPFAVFGRYSMSDRKNGRYYSSARKAEGLLFSLESSDEACLFKMFCLPAI